MLRWGQTISVSQLSPWGHSGSSVAGREQKRVLPAGPWWPVWETAVNAVLLTKNAPRLMPRWLQVTDRKLNESQCRVESVLYFCGWLGFWRRHRESIDASPPGYSFDMTGTVPSTLAGSLLAEVGVFTGGCSWKTPLGRYSWGIGHPERISLRRAKLKNLWAHVGWREKYIFSHSKKSTLIIQIPPPHQVESPGPGSHLPHHIDNFHFSYYHPTSHNAHVGDFMCSFCIHITSLYC